MHKEALRKCLLIVAAVVTAIVVAPVSTVGSIVCNREKLETVSMDIHRDMAIPWKTRQWFQKLESCSTHPNLKDLQDIKVKRKK